MKKGISEIISSVLLLAIAVSVAGVYSQWAPDFSRNTSEEIANQADNQLKCSNAAFSVSSVEYDTVTQTLSLETSNKGTINFENDLSVTAFNSSEAVGQKKITSLRTGSSESVEIEVDRSPEVVVVSSQSCPDLRTIEESITETT